MPGPYTAPGVYIEEVPSGVRTITGVATSIAAFVGRALCGPENEPIEIHGFGDYERTFGGLWLESGMSFAVRDFFLNGGSTAIVVRLFKKKAGQEAKAELTAKGLVLEAADPGSWGNGLRARIDHDVRPNADGSPSTTLFNLSVQDGPNGAIEVHRNLSNDSAEARFVMNVLRQESILVRVKTPPGATTRPDKHADLVAGDPAVPADDAKSTGVAAAKRAGDGDAPGPVEYKGDEAGKTGMRALDKADLFNLLCIPPAGSGADEVTDAGIWEVAAKYCADRRAMLLIDAPPAWNTKEKAKAGIANDIKFASRNAAIYFPRLRQRNPLRDGQVTEFAPCGAVAGVFARTDATRGVWKAPAGLEAGLVGVDGLAVSLTDAENGELNPLGVNCLRSMPAVGPVIWGSRTREGADRLASEWKYVPVRRTALMIEESLWRGTQWVVFEPNDEPLWAQIRLNIGAFMNGLFRQGAFAGATPRDVYFVKCDRETTTQQDVNLGIVNILVGFAPLKPAEFVVIRIQQMAGQIAT